eukprot:269901_1
MLYSNLPAAYHHHHHSYSILFLFLFLFQCCCSFCSWVQARGYTCTGCKSEQGCVNGFIGRIDPSKVTVRLLTIVTTVTTTIATILFGIFPELISGIRMIEEYSTTIGTLEFGYGGGGCMTNAQDDVGIGRMGQRKLILLGQLLIEIELIEIIEIVIEFIEIEIIIKSVESECTGIHGHIQSNRWLPNWNGRYGECFCFSQRHDCGKE